MKKITNLQFDFAKTKVVITGGAQGIGFAIAKSFLTAHAQVHIWDYNQAGLDAAASELKAFSPQLSLKQVNVADRKSCQTAAAATAGEIHVLINNAGITRDKTLRKISDEDFDSVIQTNLTGVYNATKALLPYFAAGGASPNGA